MKEKCVMFCTSSMYAPGVANVIIGVEKYSPGLIDNYVIYYDENDPLPERDKKAFDIISRGKALFRKAVQSSAISERDRARYGPLFTQKFHIFDLLQEYHAALYLEADMLIKGDISDIFSYGSFAWRPHYTTLYEGLTSTGLEAASGFVTKDSQAVAISAFVVKRELLDDKVNYAEELDKIFASYQGCNCGMVIDELSMALLVAKYDLPVVALPKRYNSMAVPLACCSQTWMTYWNLTLDEKPTIIHAVGPNKFWNNKLVNLLYPEWNENHGYWLSCGGSQFNSPMKYADILGDTLAAGYTKMLQLLETKTENKEERKQFAEILDLAMEKGSWSKRILTRKADIVCAYGLGEFFADRFEPWNYRELFHLTCGCDRNEEHGRKMAEQYGIDFLTLEELRELNREKKVVVILFLGNPWTLQREFLEQGLYAITAQECGFAELSRLGEDENYFANIKSDVMTVYDMLTDNESKLQYREILANYVAADRAKYTYPMLARRVQCNYFYMDYMRAVEDEIYVDCGAYEGETMESFLLSTMGHVGYAYIIEMAPDNYATLQKNLKVLEDKFPKFTTDRYKVLCVAAWDKAGEITYGNGSKSSRANYSVLKYSNPQKTQAVTIDEIIEKPITFLKINVEGAELNVLHGAEETIRRHRPKISLNVSNRFQNLWEIPLYLKSIVPQYKLFIRHCNTEIGGTILYAVCDEDD